MCCQGEIGTSLAPSPTLRSPRLQRPALPTFFLLLFLFLILFVLLGAEGAIRQAVDSDDLLVGVLEDEVLALLQLHADVNDAA